MTSKTFHNSRIVTLIRHFLLRLFNNDFMKYENEQNERVVSMLVLLFISGGLIANYLMKIYIILGRQAFEVYPLWINLALFYTYSMAITGILTLLNWDNLFLDRKDYINLSILPLNPHIFFISKFLSCLGYVGILSIAFNGFATLIMIMYVGSFLPVNILFFTIIIIFCGFLSNLFVFLSIAVIQGLFTLLFKNRFVQGLSDIIQVLLLLGCVSAIVNVSSVWDQLFLIKDKMASFHFLYPPEWFSGFFVRILGDANTLFEVHFYLIIISIVLLAVIYTLCFHFITRRYLNTLEIPKPVTFYHHFSKKITKVFHTLFLPSPVQRAMFHFMWKTLKRSKVHLLKFIVYLSFPVSLCVVDIIHAYNRTGASYFYTRDWTFAGYSLLLFACMGFGMIYVCRIPVQIEANWIFKITETSAKYQFIIGIKKALISFGAIPLFIILSLFYGHFWGIKEGILHVMFSFSIFLVIIEIFLSLTKSVPFATIHDPSRSKLKTRWPLYLSILTLLFWVLSDVSLLFIRKPFFYGLYFGVFFLFYISRFILKNKPFLKPEYLFIYEEEAEQAMNSF